MNILIIKSLCHINSGWDYLSKYFRQIIHDKYTFASVDIINIPYTSVWNSSYYFYTYKNVELKNKYDLIIVCEGKPCKKWIKNGPVIWIPCQEFLNGGSWGFITNPKNNWYSLLSPSKYLIDKVKKINKTLDTNYIQIWGGIDRDLYKYNENINDKLTLFLHFKTKNWESNFWSYFLNKINTSIPDINFILKVDNHSDINLNNIELNNIKNCIFGNLKDRNLFLDLLNKSDIYFAPRIIEGIGLCSQEAAFYSNIIIGTNMSTHNEYFSSKNGLITECGVEYNNNSPSILGEKRTLYISEKSADNIIDYIKNLNKDRLKLEKIKKYNNEYALEKNNEFVDNFTNYISEKCKKNIISLDKKRRVVHIQTCLEGGQGLVSTLIASGLEKYSNFKNKFYYLSDNDNEIATTEYLKKLKPIKGIKVNNYEEIILEESDIIIFHWSSSAHKRIENYNIIEKWINDLKQKTIGIIYDSINIMPDICDCYITPSEFNTKFSPNIKKTYIIPNQIEDYFYDSYNKYDKKYSKFVIGRISRLIDRKFHSKYEYICRYLYNKYPEISFHIIGDGNYFDILDQKFKSLNIPYKIETGLYGKNRAEVISSFDICLYMTKEHEESFCLSVAENMALGVPIVCENKGALKEVVEDSGFVCNNIYEIIESCEKLINNLEIRKEISKKCKNKALEYTNKNITNKYIKILNNI